MKRRRAAAASLLLLADEPPAHAKDERVAVAVGGVGDTRRAVVLGVRHHRGAVQYYVHYEGYDHRVDTWVRGADVRAWNADDSDSDSGSGDDSGAFDAPAAGRRAASASPDEAAAALQPRRIGKVMLGTWEINAWCVKRAPLPLPRPAPTAPAPPTAARSLRLSPSFAGTTRRSTWAPTMGAAGRRPYTCASGACSTARRRAPWPRTWSGARRRTRPGGWCTPTRSRSGRCGR